MPPGREFGPPAPGPEAVTYRHVGEDVTGGVRIASRTVEAQTVLEPPVPEGLGAITVESVPEAPETDLTGQTVRLRIATDGRPLIELAGARIAHGPSEKPAAHWPEIIADPDGEPSATPVEADHPPRRWVPAIEAPMARDVTGPMEVVPVEALAAEPVEVPEETGDPETAETAVEDPVTHALATQSDLELHLQRIIESPPIDREYWVDLGERITAARGTYSEEELGVFQHTLELRIGRLTQRIGDIQAAEEASGGETPPTPAPVPEIVRADTILLSTAEREAVRTGSAGDETPPTDEHPAVTARETPDDEAPETPDYFSDEEHAEITERLAKKPGRLRRFGQKVVGLVKGGSRALDDMNYHRERERADRRIG